MTFGDEVEAGGEAAVSGDEGTHSGGAVVLDLDGFAHAIGEDGFFQAGNVRESGWAGKVACIPAEFNLDPARIVVGAVGAQRT